MTNVAGVDIGSNTVSCVVLDDFGAVVSYDVTVAGLGRAVALSGSLAGPDIERTLGVLGAVRATISDQGLNWDDDVDVVATAACRVADNATEFLDRAEAVLGRRPRVIDGDEEARLGFSGATGGLDVAASGLDDPRVAVLDIGGGSTEISIGRLGHTPDRTVSLPVGAVQMRMTHLLHDPAHPDELTNAIGLAYDHLDDAVRTIPELLDRVAMIGVAGTVVTAATVEIGLHTWDEERVHGFELTRAAAEDVFRTLATEPIEDRRFNPGLPADRADVIVGGMCVLVAVMRRLALPTITVSTRGLSHGVALALRERR